MNELKYGGYNSWSNTTSEHDDVKGKNNFHYILKNNFIYSHDFFIIPLFELPFPLANLCDSSEVTIFSCL